MCACESTTASMEAASKPKSAVEAVGLVAASLEEAAVEEHAALAAEVEEVLGAGHGLRRAPEGQGGQGTGDGVPQETHAAVGSRGRWLVVRSLRIVHRRSPNETAAPPVTEARRVARGAWKRRGGRRLRDARPSASACAGGSDRASRAQGERQSGCPAARCGEAGSGGVSPSGGAGTTARCGRRAGGARCARAARGCRRGCSAPCRGATVCPARPQRRRQAAAAAVAPSMGARRSKAGMSRSLIWRSPIGRVGAPSAATVR